MPQQYNGNGRKVVIIGLDAITWDVVNPMIEKGELPNIKKLMEEGTYGILKSFEPTMSPVVWTSIATGKTPAKHGITDFYSTETSLKVLPLWEILSRLGKRAGIFEWLIPAVPELDSFVVPGWLTPTTKTFPPHLSFIKELEQLGKGKRGSGYIKLSLDGLKNGLHFSTLLRAFNLFLAVKVFRKPFLDGFYESILVKNAMHTDFFVRLYGEYRPDFSAVVLYATDQIPHQYWKFMFPEGFDVPQKDIDSYRDVVCRAYRESDASVGRFLSTISDDVTVFLVSDHGMGKADPDVKHVFKTEALLDHLNLSKRELAHFQILKSNLHISIKGSGKEKEELEREVMTKLGEIKVALDNGPLFDISRDGSGNILAILRKREWDFKKAAVHILGKPVNFIDLIDTEHILSAVHTLDGVYIAKGEGIKKGQRIDGATILDIAPTILYLMGYPVANDMDGKVFTNCLEPEYLEKNMVQRLSSYESYFGLTSQEEAKDELSEEDAEVIKDRLRQLGYLE